jgi:hypothetical protein
MVLSRFATLTLKDARRSPVSDKTEKVAEIEALSAKATQGEWLHDDEAQICTSNHIIASCHQGEVWGDSDAQFIASLVNLWRSGGAELVRDGLKWREREKNVSRSD